MRRARVAAHDGGHRKRCRLQRQRQRHEQKVRRRRGMLKHVKLRDGEQSPGECEYGDGAPGVAALFAARAHVGRVALHQAHGTVPVVVEHVREGVLALGGCQQQRRGDVEQQIEQGRPKAGAKHGAQPRPRRRVAL
eukprot:1408292-Prymnesium_polylepis.1